MDLPTRNRARPRLPYTIHLALGVVLGVAVGGGIVEGGPAVGLAAGWALSALATCGLLIARAPRGPVWLLLGMGLALMRLGIGEIERSEPDHIGVWLPSWPQGLDLTARGCLDRGARRTERGWRARLQVTSARARGHRWEQVHGAVRLWWSEAGPELAAGDCLEVRGVARPEAPTLLPYGFDAGAASRRQGVAATIMVAESPGSLRRTGEAGGLVAWVGRLDRARLALEGAVPSADHPRGAAWVLALGTGSRSGMPEDDRRRMVQAGIAHLLAVSGLHLALFVLSLRRLVNLLLRRSTWLLRRLDSRRASALVALPLAAAYVVFTGQGTAAFRAGIFVACLVAAELLGRPRSLAAALGLAAAIVLLLQPAELLGASFQLSFVAVAAIAVASREVPGANRRRHRDGRLARLARRLLVGLRISLAVSLATAPVLAWHFGVVSLTGVLANVLVAPALALALLPLAGLVLLVGPSSPGLAGALCELVEIVVDAAFAVLDPLVTLLGDPQVIGRPGWVEIVVFGALLAVLAAGRRAPRLRLTTRRRALALVALLLPLALARSWAPDALEVWFLPVGQGDATLLRLPSGHHVLVDTGGARRRRPGRDVVVPVLRGLGVRRLDLLVITHGDLDHAGGVDDVVRAYPPAELWVAAGSIAPKRIAELAGRLSPRGTVTRVLGEGGADRFWLGTTVIDVLQPLANGDLAEPRAASDNDSSVVLRVSDRGRVVLLTGDIEAWAESRLVARYGLALRSDLLKSPHHGSRTSSTGALLDAVMPNLTVFSVGPGNRHGLPNPDVVRRYEALGVRTYRTDRDGLVVVALRPDRTRITRSREP